MEVVIAIIYFALAIAVVAVPSYFIVKAYRQSKSK